MEVAVAGAAVGATIKVVLQNLLSYPVEEIGLLWNFKEDFQELKESVTTILEFLEDAEMNHVADKPVKRWLQKLEALAFDADYVFDQLNYQLLRKKVESGFKERKLPVQVSSSFSSYIPFSFHYKMARKIKDIKKKLKSINEEARDLGLQMRVVGTQTRGVGIETDAYSTDRVFVGRDNDVTIMVEMLITSSSTEHAINVLPIVGMGGLGKTTLARNIYKHADIVSNFGKRIWVHVPENFDPVSVLRSAAASSTGENVDGSREVVLQKLGKSLENKRYLLVLDNVWNLTNGAWDNLIASLKGINSAKGNVIMVTTRSGDVASIVKTLDIHELRVLFDEDCWLIIKVEAFGGEGVPSQFEAIGKNIAGRCRGSPLAAQVVGSLLRGKEKDEWVSIEEKWLSKFEQDENYVSNVLKLSYDNLPLPSYKKCFAFYSIVPKWWWSEKDELIQMWMAEGFLQTDKETDMEIVGNQVFNHLVQSSMIKVREKDVYGYVKRCGMHDLMHGLSYSILNPKSLDQTYQARYISTSRIEDLSSMPKDQAKCLRALFFEGQASKIMFSNFKHLHVLILVDKDIDMLPMEIGNLISLRHLDICYTRIESLPDSICHLYHLKTLRAVAIEIGRKAYLKKLPDKFKYLISLRHLYIPNIKLPPHIGKLTSLQTLPFFQVGDEEGCGIKELRSLKNLKGEIGIHNLEKVGNKETAMSADLLHKPNILKLKLVWNENRKVVTNDVHVLEGLQPHLNLKILEINGYLGTMFPLWASRMILDNLMEIRLSDCKECEEIPMLGHLPHLKSLYLKNLSNVKSLGSSFYGLEGNWVHKDKINVFPLLEKLELIGMETLTAWSDVELASSSGSQPCKLSVFGRLEYLKITDCRKLLSAPSQFQCLKELEVDNMESGVPLASICRGSKLSSLMTLRIYRVDGLVRLPDALFFNNRDLLELEISHCIKLNFLVRYICSGGGGASLRKMKIHSCPKFERLPYDLHRINALEELDIFNCQNLEVIIPSPSVGQFSSSLRRLQIVACGGVIDFPIQMIESCALSLESLFLGQSWNLKNLPQVIGTLPRMPRLRMLGVDRVPKVSDVFAEIGCLRRLEFLSIGGSQDCRDYVSFTASLDRILQRLQHLRQLLIVGIEEWDAVPDQLQYLTTLRVLRLFEFGVEALPEWLGKLASLTDLGLHHCQKLRCLPSKKAMQGLTNLTRLDIYGCPLLKQNLNEEASDADSDWSKISHIPTIDVDGSLISAPSH